MQSDHLPALGPRYWSALCLASIFGVNMGDFFAHRLGLGHIAGLPFLAAALAIVIAAERFDRTRHQIYYWAAIVIVKTAATNLADFAAGNLKLPRTSVMPALTLLLVAAVWLGWRFAWSRLKSENDELISADFGYWICLLLAGILGTIIGDFCADNLGLDDAGAAILLSPIAAVLFLIGRRGLLLRLPFYWLTVVAVMAAGTSVGDAISGRAMLGLPLSTAVTGLAFVLLLLVWKQSAKPDPAAIAAS